MGERTDSSRKGQGKRDLTRSTVEALLEQVLGKPKNTLRDIHTELVLADRQRALLARVFSRSADTLFSAEEVELVVDAVQEYGECRLPEFLFAGLEEPEKYAPPPLTAAELRTLIGVCAVSAGKDARQLVVDINRGLMAEQMRLRSALVRQSGPEVIPAVDR